MSTFRGLTLGAPLAMGPTNTTFTSFTFVNTTDQVEWIFQAESLSSTVTITKLGYRLTSVTGTSPVMKISLQGVDASGNPDGTIKGGASPASATFTPSGSATWNWVTLDNSYTANRGDWLAIVIAYSSGTLNGSNTPVISMVALARGTPDVPYAIQNVAGARTRQTVASPNYGYASSTLAYGFPLQTIGAVSISTPAERALRFNLDTAFVSTYQIAGVRYYGQNSAAAKTTKIFLYSGTTVLQTATWDSDAATSNASTRVNELWFQDATLTTLNAGTEYRISVSPQDASAFATLADLQFAAAGDLDALPGGQSWYLSTRSGGAWTDVTTSRPVMELILADWTAPTSNVRVGAGLDGGLRG